MKKTKHKLNLVVDYSHEPCVIALEEQLKRKDILKQHPYKVWKGSNGRWLSYLPDDTKESGRKLLSCIDQESLESEIVAFYEEHYAPTFGDTYREWITRRVVLNQIAHSTYNRTQAIYKKHFAELDKKKLKDLQVDDYVDFLERQIAEYGLTAKAFANLKGLLVGTLNRAKRLKLISYTGIDVSNEFKAVSEARYKQRIIEEEKEVFSEDETELVVNYLMAQGTETDIALLLIFATGLRAGECVALKQEDFGENYVVVKRTETKYLKDGKQIRDVKDSPKTAAGIRMVVIPQSFKWLVPMIKALHPEREYCFYAEKGDRMAVQTLEKRLNKVCDNLNIPRRSPHKIRKTYCSILLDNNVDRNFIRQQVGHADITTTEMFYHRNRKTIAKKAEILDSIEDFKILK